MAIEQAPSRATQVEMYWRMATIKANDERTRAVLRHVLAEIE